MSPATVRVFVSGSVAVVPIPTLLDVDVVTCILFATALSIEIEDDPPNATQSTPV